MESRPPEKSKTFPSPWRKNGVPHERKSEANPTAARGEEEVPIHSFGTSIYIEDERNEERSNGDYINDGGEAEVPHEA
jgi:hypothetical protein